MASRFADRSVFITGGAAGIGLATAQAFAAEGGRVTIADIDEELGLQAVASIEAAGGHAAFVRTDATDEASTKAAIAFACETFGPVRHAFNNIGAPRGTSIEDTTLEEWEWTVKMSLTSVFLGMKHQIPVMRAAGGGTIVNTASNTASLIVPTAPAGYTSAKAAVIHLSHYGAVVYGKDNIRVNSVSPGLTATPLIFKRLSPQQQQEVCDRTQTFKRMVLPEEIAAAVLYLSGDESAMVTGLDIEVGGGRLF